MIQRDKSRYTHNILIVLCQTRPFNPPSGGGACGTDNFILAVTGTPHADTRAFLLLGFLVAKSLLLGYRHFLISRRGRDDDRCESRSGLFLKLVVCRRRVFSLAQKVERLVVCRDAQGTASNYT